nr:hypothetical protein [Anaerolineae bacterium]
MSIKRVFIVMMLAAMMLTGASLTGAQAPAPTAAGEYTGVLENLQGTLLTVSGLTFDVTNVVLDDDVQWAPGVLTEISFTSGAGVLTANFVDDADDGTGTGYLIGTLEAIDGATVTVGGLVFAVTPDSFDDDVTYEVGMLVEVDFAFNGGLLSSDDVEAWGMDDADEADEEANEDE